MQEEEAAAIRESIYRQFSSLSWTEEREADWQGFARDFHEEASLWPSARPATRQTVVGFVNRMQGLAAGSVRSLQERVTGTEVRVFGNIAVASVGCEMVENDREVSRTIEMLLLVKSEGEWRVVAQAWDKERPEHGSAEWLQA